MSNNEHKKEDQKPEEVKKDDKKTEVSATKLESKGSNLGDTSSKKS